MSATTTDPTTVTTPGTTPSTTPIDEAAVEACTQRIFGAYVDSVLVLMIDLADRTGMLDGLAAGPGTSPEVAVRTGLDERYVRECLAALVAGGLVGYDPVTGRYHLSPEHAMCLTGERATNLAPLSRLTTLLAHHVAEGAEVARTGGGIPYERFRPDFTTVMDGISRRVFDGPLLASIVPLDDDLPDRLERGIRVADIGCGTGHSTVVLAEAFPASSFVGYDLSDDALEVGRAEARAAGLANVTFEQLDVRELPDDPPFDLVVGFDVIHDQVDPAGVLDRVVRSLTPGGLFLMLDIRAASRLEDNLANPLAPFLYGISTLHCMTVSLAHGGAGLGTVWPADRARVRAGACGATVTDREESQVETRDEVVASQLRPGAEWVVEMHPPGWPRWLSRSTVEELDRDRLRFVHTTRTDDGNPSRGTWTWQVRPAGDGAQLSVTWRMCPRTVGRRSVIARLRRPMLRAEVRRSLDALEVLLTSRPLDAASPERRGTAPQEGPVGPPRIHDAR